MAPIMRNVKRSLFLLIAPTIIALLYPLPSAGEELTTREYKTRSGKSLLIEEGHPVGQSLSDISLRSTGFEHNLSDVQIFDHEPSVAVMWLMLAAEQAALF